MPEDNGLSTFLDALAAGTPTPGGGGAAAAMGAMGAALVSMVCNLTLGRKGHEAVEPAMREVLADSEALRRHMTALVADDAAAFQQVLDAYRLPRAGDDDKARRDAAIQAGLKAATLAPLACARAAAEGVRLAARAVEHGNVNAISDVGVGVLASLAAVRSAGLNVQINTPQIRDAAFVAQALAEADALATECSALADAVHARVKARIG